MSPRVVCFDLGGVLIRIHRTWEDLARAAHMPVRALDLDGPTATAIQGVLVDYQRGIIDVELMASRISAAMQGVYDPTEVVALHRAQLREQYEDVEPVIAALAARGVTTAILSNTCADHWARLITYPAVARIAHRFASHEIGALKPEDEAYATLEKRLDARGANVLFFDDTHENVLAARQRGWRAVRIDPEGATGSQMRQALEREGLAI